MPLGHDTVGDFPIHRPDMNDTAAKLYSAFAPRFFLTGRAGGTGRKLAELGEAEERTGGSASRNRVPVHPPAGHECPAYITAPTKAG